MTRLQICKKANRVRRSILRRTFITRFWARVVKTSKTGCWIWNGELGPRGYGRVKKNGEHLMAHRVSYELEYGKIPEGKYVCHHCDQPRCVNPKHLFVGSASDNVIDAIRKGRWYACKLTIQQVKEIRKSPLRNVELARLYPVRANTICTLRLNKTWKHVT